MDLFQAERLREDLAGAGLLPDVRTPRTCGPAAEFQTVVFPSPPRGERDSRSTWSSRAFISCATRGLSSPCRRSETTSFTRNWQEDLRQIIVPTWAKRACRLGRARRRATRAAARLVVQARVGDGESLRFVTRPGVFAYGQMDLGSRALLTAAEIQPGERILDLGCGAGATGIAAWSAPAGPARHFVDSNVRAAAWPN